VQTQDKFSPTDRDTVTNAVREVDQWIQEKGEAAEKEEYEVRRKQRSHLCSRRSRALGCGCALGCSLISDSSFSSRDAGVLPFSVRPEQRQRAAVQVRIDHGGGETSMTH